MSQSAQREEQALLAKLVVFDAKNRVFWRLLEKHLTPLRNRLKPRTEVTVLDVGCGVCEEARVLTAFFGGNPFDLPSHRVRLFGVEIDPTLVEQAKLLCKIPSPTEPPSPFVVEPRCEFFAGDATRLTSLPGVPPSVDVVVLRHQFLASDLLRKNAVWATILSQSLAALAPDGTMLLTSYREAENELLLKVLAVYPCDVVGNHRNREALSQQLPDMPDSHFDKYLTIVKKRPS